MAVGFAAGEFFGRLICAMGETDEFEQAREAFLRQGFTVQERGQRDVFRDGQGGDEVEVLEDNPHGSAAEQRHVVVA